MTPALFFSQRTTVVLLASFCCCLWGSAYPAIKNGYLLFGIETGDVPSKFVFAGYRFLFAGLVLLALAVLNRRPIFNMDSKLFRDISIVGLVQTGLQYTFFYVGLAHTTGVKGSIMNATGTFFSFLLAHFCYGNDRLNTMKLLGCLIGFLGVTVVNFSQDLLDFDFSLLGDGFVIMSAFVLSAASIFGKRVSQRVDTLILTGYQLAIGGLALLAAGYVMGGTLSGFTLKSSMLLVYLILLSSVAFALWTALLKYNRVGLVTVFNFLIPVFGAVLSAVFLGESILEWKNLVALGLVSSGIWLVTREARGV
jgi:drug/metabolite transporter (DMT)-like permease